MKRLLVLILCLVTVLCGCTGSYAQPEATPQAVDVAVEAEPKPTAEPVVKPTPVQEEVDAQKALDAVRAWFDKEASFSIYFWYDNPEVNGFSGQVIQNSAQDDSFYFYNSQLMWDHKSDYNGSNINEWYYINEGTEFVTYRRINDEPVERMVLSSGNKEELTAGYKQFVGAYTLLPKYVRSFALDTETEQTDTCYFTFSLPVKQVLNTNSYLANFLLRTYTFYYGSETAELMYKQSESNILCRLEVEKDTFMPISLQYDFSQLAKEVLPAEVPGKEELIVFEYTFKYDLIETIVVPEEFMMGAAR